MRKKPFIVAITGASGSVYGLRLLRQMLELDQKVFLTISHAASVVIQEEMGVRLKNLEDPEFLPKLLPNCDLSNLEYCFCNDLTAPIASGSFPTKAMLIVPASTTCFARIACGISASLIERAAECTIKEGRRLVIVPRETPLSSIHLENLLKLSKAGVRVVPAVPGFYAGAQTIDDMIDFVVGRILDQIELPHALYRRWTGSVVAQEGMENS